MTRRKYRAIKGFTVKGWWQLASAARYLQDVGEATSREIVEHARAKNGSRLGLTVMEMSSRMAKHNSFKSRKVDRNKATPVRWSLANDNIFLENPNDKNTRVKKEWKE